MMELNEETPKDVAADEESSEDEDGIVFNVAETGEDEDDGSAKAEVAINSILTDKDETEEPRSQDEEEEDDSVHVVVFGKDGTGKSDTNDAVCYHNKRCLVDRFLDVTKKQIGVKRHQMGDNEQVGALLLYTKTLIVRLLTRRFIHEYDPTSEDVYAHHCIVDGDSVVMKLLDTAGMIERNVHEREEQIRWGDGYLLVLSLTCPESIPELHMIKALIDQVDEDAKPKVVVANKRDLLHARQVMASEVQQLGNEWDCPVFEVAATEEYTVVEEPFFSLCREIIKRRKLGRRIPSVTKLHKELVLADAHKRCEVKRPLNDNGLQFQELCDGEDVQFSS